jgi:putative transposase
MARPIRVEFEGALYHVTARGNERREIFRSDSDRTMFMAALEQCVEENGLVLHAWCLMPNHYHLILATPRANLSRALGWLQTTYTVRFNRRHSRSGHLFQGRFKAHLVEADDYARGLVRYLHLNPVRSKHNKGAPITLEEWERLQAFPWSSHKDYMGKRQPPRWRSLDWLAFFGASRRVAIKEYARYMKLCLEEPVQSPWKELRGGLVLGGEELWTRISRVVRSKTGAEELHWRRREAHTAARTERLRKLVDQEEDTRVKIWLQVRLGHQRKVDIAREHGYRDGSAILQILKRLEHSAANNRALQRKLNGFRALNVSSVQS